MDAPTIRATCVELLTQAEMMAGRSGTLAEAM
jgi:hypothetical protein